ncbi:MAG TPA: MtnX-like HAD-IB family phosphatase [bacterium]|jgi:2,3-diketo-5-methylthio-1-phosphopentane phosphatase
MTDYSICCDFDGTISIPDACDFLLQRYAPPEWKELDDAVWSGRLTEREAFPRQIGLLNVTWEDACAAMDKGVIIRDGFAEFIAFCRRNNLPFMILSGGLRPLIETLLARAGVPDVPVISHTAQIDGRRWKAVLWDGKRHAEHCSHCKCSYVLAERAAGKKLVYIGDGYTDLCPAQHADILFATGNLARECLKSGRPFIPYETFYDIEHALGNIIQTEQDLRR